MGWYTATLVYPFSMHMGTKPRTGDLTFRMPLFDDEVRCDLARARLC